MIFPWEQYRHRPGLMACAFVAYAAYVTAPCWAALIVLRWLLP